MEIKSKIRITVVLSLILLVVGGMFMMINQKKVYESINGTWTSIEVEDQGNGTFATRTFIFNDNDWLIEYTLYMDKDKNIPVFSFIAEGEYEIMEKSSYVEDAFNTIFKFNRKSIVLLTDNEDLVSGFGLNALEYNVLTNISETGISFFPSVKQYDREYDLIKLEDNKLRLGARPEGFIMNEEKNRPTQLGEELIKN